MCPSLPENLLLKYVSYYIMKCYHFNNAIFYRTGGEGMTTLYLIRHAEAEGNLYRRIHGQYNSLITDNGYRQIQALQNALPMSPLTRCIPATCSGP